jgi:tetratricopeptide (TPR) repeat protein
LTDRCLIAIQIFEEALKIDPDSCEAWINLSRALLRDAQFEYCIIACEKALGSEVLVKYWENDQKIATRWRVLISLFYLGRYEEVENGVAELKKLVDATELKDKMFASKITHDMEVLGHAAAFYKVYSVQTPNQPPPKVPIYKQTSYVSSSCRRVLTDMRWFY